MDEKQIIPCEISLFLFQSEGFFWAFDSRTVEKVLPLSEISKTKNFYSIFGNRIKKDKLLSSFSKKVLFLNSLNHKNQECIILLDQVLGLKEVNLQNIQKVPKFFLKCIQMNYLLGNLLIDEEYFLILDEEYFLQKGALSK